VKKILIADDENDIVELLSYNLKKEGYEVFSASNGKEALEQAKLKPDVILLDVMMPVKDGLSLAREIRVVNKTVPIIFLTAKSMKEDTIEGFNAGADDYITKPFSMEELLVRVNAVLRRSNKGRSEDTTVVDFKIGEYHFNSKKQILQSHGNEQKLTTKESQLLHLLCVYKNDVLDRGFALKSIWHDDNYFNGRSMDVYIAKLRKYLKEDPNVEIVNIHGNGFRLIVK